MGNRRPTILLFFEYATLNGGEFSLLAMLESLAQSEFCFVAAVPPSGPFNERLKQCDVQTLPMILRDSEGRKRPLAEIDAHLMDLIHRVSPDPFI